MIEIVESRVEWYHIVFKGTGGYGSGPDGTQNVAPT